MAAAVAGGLYPTVLDAQKAMGNGYETEYLPDENNALKYRELYENYSRYGAVIETEILKNNSINKNE
jgi:L-ribulokinase